MDEVDPNELEGFTPDQVLVIPEAHPLHGIGLFTWRNAILGAVTSGALLLGSVVAYLAMWALGIGPVGSLVAQGVILTGDSLVVAQFVNRTDDASLGALVTDAFELDLTESNVVTVVEARSLRGALARRGHDPTAPLTPEVAHQMAMDEGLKVVVEGDLARRASGYLLTAEIVQPQGRSSLARFEEFVEGDEELFRAIDRLSERIREKLGESLMAIRRYDPLEGLASPSPEALTLYGLAGRAEVAGDDTEAIDLLVQAVGVDPAFAMAWRKLGVVYEQRADTARALDAYRNVIRLWTVEGDEGPRTVDLLRARIAALEN